MKFDKYCYLVWYWKTLLCKRVSSLWSFIILSILHPNWRMGMESEAFWSKCTLLFFLHWLPNREHLLCTVISVLQFGTEFCEHQFPVFCFIYSLRVWKTYVHLTSCKQSWYEPIFWSECISPTPFLNDVQSQINKYPIFTSYFILIMNVRP